jgi:aldehyde dehydrogenase (NAD+)
VQALYERAAARFGDAPDGLSALLIGGPEIGELLVDDIRLPLVSATGSTAMGRKIGPRLARRFARALLELGGNNASIVCPSADLNLALRAIAFAAIGTAGQRCTSLRRLFVHRAIYNALIAKLKQVYASVRIGNPLLQPDVLVGPLIDSAAFHKMEAALAEARAVGGEVFGGGRHELAEHPEAFYARPALVELPGQIGPALRETFAPILYVMPYSEFDDALAMHNAVPYGLSSSIFTADLREAEIFISAAGSDCGIANVNMGPSGAEIGGAFGGEKETGGGREAGSDSWRAYMRRLTSAINYGRELPLAQGVRFDIE